MLKGVEGAWRGQSYTELMSTGSFHLHIYDKYESGIHLLI